MDMIELVYVSKAVQRLKQEQLEEILSKARKNNTESGITGLLLYDGYGTFIQVLEGPEDAVETLFEKIKVDTRHTHINRIGLHFIHARSFPDWQMGFKILDEDSASTLTGYSDFLQSKRNLDYLLEHKSFAMRMIKHFVKKD